MDKSFIEKFLAPLSLVAAVAVISVVIVLNNKSNEINELKTDIAEIKSNVNEINEFFKKIRPPEQRNQQQPQPTQQVDPTMEPQGPDVSISIKGDPYVGSKSAPLVLVEVSEYQCPFCAKYFLSTYNKIKAEYIDTGKIGYTFKDFPLAFDAQAQKASEAAHCAGDQDKYWQMHDVLFRNQKRLYVPDLKDHAKFLGLNLSKFNDCLDSNKYEKKVKDNLNAASAIGISGTPTFILGKVNSSGVVTGTLIRGAKPFEAFQSAIDRQLAK